MKKRDAKPEKKQISDIVEEKDAVEPEEVGEKSFFLSLLLDQGFESPAIVIFDISTVLLVMISVFMAIINFSLLYIILALFAVVLFGSMKYLQFEVMKDTNSESDKEK